MAVINYDSSGVMRINEAGSKDDNIEQNEDSHQVVADYIAGMTDEFFISEYNKLVD